MVIGNPDAVAATAAINANAGGDNAANNNLAHPSGIPQDKIDNIMSGIANTGNIKMNNHRKKLRQRFDIIKKLGQGTYGKVQLGINKETGQEVAIKTIKKCKIEAEADLVRIRREVQIMSSVYHPNIIHIYEVFENREKMVLVMEFAAGGELYDYLSERKVLSEEEARRIFRQVATAVYYCHKHKICHRDLKLENILLDEHGNAKIADFGLSNVFDDQRLLATFCGSPLYASPEIVEGTPYHGPEVDCWSLGVLLYTLVYGSMPFDGSNFKRLVKQISQGDYYEPKKPSRASSLIRDMLTVCPRKRATIEQICSHWWVNENDNVSCLDLAEDLANQTPVRLDVLLSLTPVAVTAEQLVVPSADGTAAGKGSERVPRSHSVGSIRDMGAATEAERRILDMVAAGGEAALMPSPTRTITPAQSPVQSKRKLQTTVSTDNAAGSTVKKKEKPGSSSLVINEGKTTTLTEETPMEAEDVIMEEPKSTAATEAIKTAPSFSQKDMELLGDLCEKLITDKSAVPATTPAGGKQAAEAATPAIPRQKTVGKLDSVEEAPEEKDATKVIKKFVNKHKTADLVNAIGQIAPEKAANESSSTTTTTATPTSNAATSMSTPTAANKTVSTTAPAAPPPFVRKCSLQDESQLNKFNAERRKSRILETAEKFQQMNAGAGGEKPKKFSIPGVSVGNFKKEFERKATTPAPSGPTAGELRAIEQVAAAAAAAQELENAPTLPETATDPSLPLESSDSKNSVTSLSLDDARRSMENSIALLRQAQNESTKEVDQLCAKTENIGVSDTPTTPTTDPLVERERKLKNARAIIGNAIQPVIRRPLPPTSLSLYGIGGVDDRGAGGDIGGGYYGGIPLRGTSSFAGNFHGSGFGGGGGSSSNSSTPPASPPVSLSQSPSPMFMPNAHVTIAAARQNIIDRLAGTTTSDYLHHHHQQQQQQQPHHHQQQQQLHKLPQQQQQQQINVRNVLPSTTTGKKTFIYNLNTPIHQHRRKEKQHLQAQHYLQQKLQQAAQQQQQKQLPKYFNHTMPSLSSSLSSSASASSPQHHRAQPQSSHSHPQPPSSPSPSNKIFANANGNLIAATNTSVANAIPNASIATINSVPKPFYNAQQPQTPSPSNSNSPSSISFLLKSSPGGDGNAGTGTVKTSTASITLKSATLPRRKTAKTEIQLDIKPRIVEEPTMRFTTEMQHPVPDLRSAPAREGPIPYSPIKATLSARATSLEPKEHIIPIQRPQAAYTRTTSNTTNRSGSLSRQSTVDSESDTTTTATNMSQSTLTGSSQPIKKSPREFIIPIAMEGGGFITPREGSIEPSEPSHTTASSRSTFSRLRPARRIGSLLSEAGVDESSPFQMRTSSINRDGDDDTPLRLHKLRSSRPVKKISQDNDSQSSGEEDDDDGFEILTAENLFSTLLQRVRALTNRLNVNNDLTAGFPNSSRLLSNMRQGQSPFWNTEPFGRSQVSYSYSQTVEKKHVRLNNPVGTPWRHSMSRDLGRDMESMFSRTGATLPRGNKATKTQNRTTNAEANTNESNGQSTATINGEGKVNTSEEPLDLADLDLSRLRLSKKDLETLSSIAPGLPKCFQEQLLAKLPPTQARKLSRTLSLQGSTATPSVKVYKRSQSGGRGVLHEAATPTLASELKEQPVPEEGTTEGGGSSRTSDDSSERTMRSSLYRRSLSRTRYDYETPTTTTSSNNVEVSTTTSKSRSSSVCRDDYGKSLCTTSAYTSDINDKYKYYSPYLSKGIRDYSAATTAAMAECGSTTSPYRRYATLGRPPSGCLSPPPSSTTLPTTESSVGNGSLRRRPSQRQRISRFLRPDFYDEQPSVDENPYQREKRLRERETQNVLREIREKSREPSRERLSAAAAHDNELLRRKHSLPNSEELQTTEQKPACGHVRNKSLEVYAERAEQEASQRHRRSLSRPRDISSELDKHELADRILQELQLLSAVRSQQEQQRLSVPREISVERSTEIITQTLPKKVNVEEDDEQDKTGTIKKLKKVKPKEKSTDSSATDADGKTTTTTTVVRKMRKIVKKAEVVRNPNITEDLIEGTEINANDLAETAKKESKLKRPKSYPTKELAGVAPKTELLPGTGIPTKLPTKQIEHVVPTELPTITSPSNSGGPPRESRLIRPKSYPASKLTPPKESKKVTRSGIAIASIAETNLEDSNQLKNSSLVCNSIEKPTSQVETESSNATESRPSSLKKIIKVSKKSKLVQPTPVTPTTPSTATTTTTGDDDSKESSPTVREQSKEKSPEKKHSKGLLYAIGQKFEKFRDSAMHKEKKSNAMPPTANGNLPIGNSKKSSPESSSSPEKIKEKSTLLKKKSTKTEKPLTANTGEANANKTTHTPNAVSDIEKPAPKDKRSRIDAMIRSLRERSVPRGQVANSESNYIKRAVSVEEMPGTFNKNAVNKVLGLFKRFEKDGGDRRVRNTRSTSNIERQIRESSSSPIYQNAAMECRVSRKTLIDAGNKKQSAVADASHIQDNSCNCKLATTCPDCVQDRTAAVHQSSSKRCVIEEAPIKTTVESATVENGREPGNKDKRKGLMLDLVKLDKLDSGTSSMTSSNRNTKSTYVNGNGNGIYSNLPPYPGAMNSSSNNSSSQQSVDNAANNNNNNNSCTNNNSSSLHTSQTSGYRTSSANEINRNHLLTPSNENIANYSSDSRSYQDDCASTSTFLSPTDEPELYFDNWSICSEDNYMLHATPSPTVSRLSRASQLSSPTRGGESSDPNESVIDRIKRRSFYCRFNDKKPKRTSSIVGPSAVRDYYREQQAAVKARSNNKINNVEPRATSPDIVRQFLAPLKLSPAGTELKPPIYKSPHDNSAVGKSRKSLSDIRPTMSTSPSFLLKRYGAMAGTTDSDYLSLSGSVPTRYKSSSSSSAYENNGGVLGSGGNTSNYYSTYNPKRRSSYTLNGSLPHGSGSMHLGSSNIDGYATMGRRSIRPYDQRTLSLLDSSHVGTGSSSYRREARTPVRDYTSSISRSNSRYRTSSTSRSPTNI